MSEFKSTSMKKLNFKKDILPHLVAIVVFVLIVVIYYHPLFFSSETISQNDVLQGVGGGQEAIEYREQTEEEALWVNSMFGGMPAYLINVYWSGDLLSYVQRVFSLGLPTPAESTFFAFISFYILLLVFRVRPYLAIIGALAYGLNSFNIISIEAGHMWKVRAIAFMPLVLAGFHLLFRKDRNLIWGFTLTALAIALEIRSNHFQITYYLVLLLLFYGINVLIEAFKTKNFKPFFQSTGLLILATILAVGCNLGRLWSTYEYSQYSTRGKSDLTQKKAESGLDRDYVFAWSSGKMESLTLLIPNFYGGASQQRLDEDSNLATALRANGVSPQQINQFISSASTYWGNQPFTSGPIYVGAIVCFLFVLGILMAGNKVRFWLIAATVFSIMLSWGKNFDTFNYLMYDYFPGYNKFRAVSMAISIALFTIPLLGFIGLEKLVQIENKKAQLKPLLIAVGVTGGIALLTILFAGAASFEGVIDQRLASLPDWFVQALREDREALMRSDAFRSLIFILLAAGVLYFTLQKKLSLSWSIIIVGALVLIDLWAVDKRYLNDENFVRNSKQKFFAATAADKKLESDSDLHFRVLNLANPWNEARTSYHHSSVGGYHGAKLKRYQELIDHCLDEQKNSIIQLLQEGKTDFSEMAAINMLNTKYLTYGPEASNVIQNPYHFGNAWLVDEIQKTNSADEAIAATCNLKSKNIAVVDVSRFKAPDDISASGTIKLEEYKPNYLKYSVNANNNTLAVFSEIYYPKGWTAKIDGKEVDILQANYILRAVEIPQGEHMVEFEFRPKAYHIGNKVMMASSGLLIVLLIGSIAWTFLKKPETD